MKCFVILLFYFFCAIAGSAAQPWHEHGALQVSRANPHYLAFTDGTPFFWTGDTGWELFHRLIRQEARDYLDQRAQQEFNVIQAVLLSEFDGLKAPNAYGDLPLVDGDPLKPAVMPGADPTDPAAYDYWDHAEYIIKLAAERGMYVGVLPCWGEYVVPREGRAIFNTEDQAYAYGFFVGNRFRSAPNIIWILGGDRQPDERPEGVGLWRAMAEGIADGVNGTKGHDGQADYSTTLMTHHAFGSSSQWFHQDEWIDLHMWGSYHDDYYSDRAWQVAHADWSLPNPKPTLNGEPAYEEHPLNWLDDNGVFTAYDVRIIAYGSVLAGACGHTYGGHPVWQFYDSTRAPISLVKTPWRKALLFPGAQQMKWLKRLFLSRPLLDLQPDPLIIVGRGESSSFQRAARGKDYAFIYLPTGRPVTINLSAIAADSAVAWWYNPRTGEATRIGLFAAREARTFDPPGLSVELPWLQTGRGCDWVLVVDDQAAGYSAPGDWGR